MRDTIKIQYFTHTSDPTSNSFYLVDVDDTAPEYGEFRLFNAMTHEYEIFDRLTLAKIRLEELLTQYDNWVLEEQAKATPKPQLKLGKTIL